VQLPADRHDTAAVWICAHQSAREQVAADLRDAGFAPAQLPEFTGTAAEQSARLENEKNEILRQQEALVQDWKALSAELTHLKVWYDVVFGAELLHHHGERCPFFLTLLELCGFHRAEEMRHARVLCICSIGKSNDSHGFSCDCDTCRRISWPRYSPLRFSSVSA